MIDLDAMSAALEPTRKGLEAAGFQLAIAEVEGRLQLKVIAAPEACEDCLVPKSLFRRMADDEIDGHRAHLLQDSCRRASAG
jgi:hypothetical protein